MARDKDSNDALFAYVGKSKVRQELLNKFKEYAEADGSNVSLELFRAVKEYLEKRGIK